MKKLFIITITLLILNSCSSNLNKRPYDDIYPIISKVQSNNETIVNIRLYIIDSCEYIGRVNNTFADYLTHKGNCKYCLQKTK